MAHDSTPEPTTTNLRVTVLIAVDDDKDSTVPDVVDAVEQAIDGLQGVWVTEIDGVPEREPIEDLIAKEVALFSAKFADGKRHSFVEASDYFDQRDKELHAQHAKEE